MIRPEIVILLFSAFIFPISLFYLKNFAIPRPKLGVYNLSDVIGMMVGIILIPYFYLALPKTALAIWFFSMDLFLFRTFLAPIFRRRAPAVALGLLFLVTSFFVYSRFGTISQPYLFLNNILLVCGITTITNVWVQNGIKAKNVAQLAAVITFYDLVATKILPLTANLSIKAMTIPFFPLFMGWTNGQITRGLGLGDQLFFTLFSLIMYKAFGRAAAISSFVINFSAIVIILLRPHISPGVFPAMVVLGPLMIIQYLFWSRKYGTEKTMREFRAKFPALVTREESLVEVLKYSTTPPTKQKRHDTVFILVHGAGFGSWIWEKVIPKLSARAVVVTLPGRKSKENFHSFEEYVQVVVRAIESVGKNKRIILVGHSIGSEVVLAAANRMPESVSVIVAAGGLIPRSGKSFYSLVPQPQKTMLKLTYFVNKGGIRPTEKNITKPFADELDPATLKKLKQWSTAESPKLFDARINWSSIPEDTPRYYIKFLKDKSLTASLQNKMARTLHAKILEVNSGHLGMLSEPDQFASALNAILSWG